MKTFIRVRSTKDITISVSLIILGCVLVALPTGTGVNVAGFFLIFAGIALAIFMKTGYKDTETRGKFQKKEIYFQQAMNAAVASAIASKPETVDLSEADKGSALKLDIYYSKSSGKAYLQLFEYIPYKYESCSKMYEYDLARVGKLIK